MGRGTQKKHNVDAYDNIKQSLSFSPQQELDQISTALLPDVQWMLPSRAGRNVLTITRETAFLP